MSSSHNTPPATTASAVLGGPHSKTKRQHAQTKNEAGASTETHRPTEPAPEAASTDKDSHVLEREPDGRYRIIGRKPRQQD
jgi:hypothetical protein